MESIKKQIWCHGKHHLMPWKASKSMKWCPWGIKYASVMPALESKYAIWSAYRHPEAAYKALIRPHLEYASPAWSPHTSKNIDKIEAVQKRAARFVLGNYEYGPQARITEQIQNKLHWHPLRHRRAIYDLVVFYKIRNNKVIISFPSSVTLSTRHAKRYNRIKILHSDAFKYSFYCRTIRLWNDLPVNVLESDSLDVFKTRVVNWITPLHWVKVANTWALA